MDRYLYKKKFDDIYDSESGFFEELKNIYPFMRKFT